MSIDLTVYVGPYLILPKDFEYDEWDDVVTDGRMEAGLDESFLILIPNVKLPGIDREMVVDPHGEQQLQHINPAMMVRETRMFISAAAELFSHCDDNDIDIREAWGVVPCWSY